MVEKKTSSIKTDTGKTINELKLHQIELEKQNKELQEALREAELKLNNYSNNSSVSQKFDWSVVRSALKEDENLFRIVFENSPIGKSITGVDGSLHVNQAFCDIVGYTEEELRQKTFMDISHPDEVEQTTEVIQLLLSGKISSIQLEKRYIHKNGSIIFTQLSTFLQRNNDGVPQFFISSIFDITEKKETERRLKESEERTKNLITKMMNAFALHELIYDENGKACDYRFLEVNPAWEKNVGIKSEMVIGKTIREIMPNVESSWIERYAQIVETGIWEEFEDYNAATEKYFYCYAYPTEQGRFAVFFNDVTERRKIIEDLKESEMKFRSLYDNAPLSYQSLNEDGSFRDVNPSWLRTLGYERDEVIGKFYKDFLHPDWISHFEDNFPKFKARGYVSDVQFKIRHKKGYYLDISFEGCIAYNPDGSVRQTYCVFQDITEKKKEEEKLRESEERFNLAMSASKDGLFDWDLITNKIYYSPSWKSMLGYKDDELINDFSVWESLVKPKDLDASWKMQEKVIKKEVDRFELEFKMKHKNGHWVDILSRAEAIFDDNGNAIRMIGTHVDITESKLVEQALKESEERFRLLHESAGVGIGYYTPKGVIISFNSIAIKNMNGKAEDFVGKSIFDIFPKDTAKFYFARIVKSINSSVSLEFEDKIDLPSGIKWMQSIFTRIQNSSHKVIGVQIVSIDITEKKNFEESIQRSQKLESLGVLAGGIAHDFNNLLSGIFGYNEMAMIETTEEKVSSYLSESLNNIERARSLTQQLLTFAKGGIPIKKVLKLFPFIKETVQFALSGSSVSSNFQVQDDLWVCDIDKNQICQVVDNITINAIQAMPKGGIIEVSAQNISLSKEEHVTLIPGNYVKISIKDQGVGIPKEFLPRVFDPYYTTKPKGHGLGLSTCYSIIKRHDGFIDVESELGKGSVFHIYLPASSLSIQTKESKISGKHKGVGTFLVMDDDKVVRQLMKKMIETFGYTVVLKSNGQDTIDFFKKEIEVNRKVSGMIFDLTIPGGMGGKETIKEIRKLCTETPIFVFSGYSADPIIANPEEYGFTASISKPFVLSELSEMLEKHIKYK